MDFPSPLCPEQAWAAPLGASACWEDAGEEKSCPTRGLSFFTWEDAGEEKSRDVGGFIQGHAFEPSFGAVALDLNLMGPLLVYKM